MLAVAPLFLFPFCGAPAIASVLLWLSLAGVWWILMEPSLRGGEMLHDARRRVWRAVGRDPLFWTLLVVVAITGVRALNTGIAMDSEVSSQLLHKNGHDPSPEEIAEELDMGVDKVREIMRIAQDPVSLETPIGEEEDSHLGDFIPDDDAPAPAEAASLVLLKEQINQVLSTLTEREEQVLRLRFGLEDGRSRTLEEVGKKFNVTRERIRQIEAKALRKLRHPNRSNKVRDYLD